MAQIKSFSDLAFLFDEIPDHVPGKWFLLAEREITNKRNKQFANKSGERPVVLGRVAGPNAIVFPRSSSIPGGFKHQSHAHAEMKCVVNRDGWVVLDCPYTISADVLTNETFSCFEPANSSLIAELVKVRAA